jgi:hypothetical protein
VYTCGVYFEGTELGRGSGASKQAAEVLAAKQALHFLSLGEDNDHFVSLKAAQESLEGYDEDYGTKRK